jgi:predicted transposase/invertase (TIGR01784 family)
LTFGDTKSEAEMAALTENDPRIIEAHREFLRFNANPQTRELARQLQLFLVDYHLGMAASKAEGRAEGRDETLIEMARKLKSCGVDNETIMKITGLSLKKIEHLN